MTGSLYTQMLVTICSLCLPDLQPKTLRVEKNPSRGPAGGFGGSECDILLCLEHSQGLAQPEFLSLRSR